METKLIQEKDERKPNFVNISQNANI